MFLKKLFELRQRLAFRLTLWYAGLFTISSLVAFSLFFLLITSAMGIQTDRNLLKQAGVFTSLAALNGIDAVKNLALIEVQAAGEKKIFFRLIYRSRDIFTSSNMSYWQNIGISREAIGKLSAGSNVVFDTIVIPEREYKVRMLYGVIGPGIILQLGHSMQTTFDFIEDFKKIFTVTMSGLIVFAAFIGWFMARRAVSGIEAVTRTARQIAGGTLDERVPVKSGNNEIDQLATTFNRMLDRIQTLVTEIKEMSDNIAHDLKSPLTRIRGGAEITLTTGKSVSEYEVMAASTIEECDRLLDMINTMLVISRTETGVDAIRPVNLDLTDLIIDACELFKPIADDKGVVLTCELSDRCHLWGDLRLIQRMIANLLDNAVKYTPAGERVDVSLEIDRTQGVIILVEDTGPGISAKDLPHIFERFYRCDESRSEFGGGLGLSLARTIARAHGGDITVSSHLGSGSSFKVVLPHQSHHTLEGDRVSVG